MRPHRHIRTNFALGLALVILVLIGLLTERALKISAATARQVSHTYEVIDEMNLLLRLVVDVETSQRGFGITGLESDLEPYHLAVWSINQASHKLRWMTADDSRLQASLDRLESLINRRLLYAKTAIEARRTSGLEAANLLVTSGDGSVMMRQIRSLLQDLRKEKEAVLHQRIAQDEASSHELKLVIMAGGTFALLLLVVGFRMLDQENVARRLAEESQKASETRVRLLLDSTAEGIYGLDLEGQCTFCNNACLQLLGYDHPDELLGRNMHEVTHHSRHNGEPYAAEDCQIHQAHRQDRPCHVDMSVIWRKDGTRFWCAYWSHPMRSAGKVIGAVVSFVDITERREARKKLRRLNASLERRVQERTTELQEANRRLEAEIAERHKAERDLGNKNRDLETLLYVTSHDLKEPLRAIQNFSQMIHDRYADRLDDKGRDYLTRVVRAGQRLQGLLDDVLELSRAQRLTVPAEQVDFQEIVEAALESLGDRLKATQATVTVTGDFHQGQVDRFWAKQAIYNLVANALKYTVNGSPPQIEIAPYHEVGAGAPAIGIVVRDRGPGVAPEHAERIFSLFQRAVSRDIEGSGAGLAIVSQVAERHGGRAWVRPRPGGGSEFIITFVRNSKSPSANPELLHEN